MLSFTFSQLPLPWTLKDRMGFLHCICQHYHSLLGVLELLFPVLSRCFEPHPLSVTGESSLRSFAGCVPMKSKATGKANDSTSVKGFMLLLDEGRGHHPVSRFATLVPGPVVSVHTYRRLEFCWLGSCLRLFREVYLVALEKDHRKGPF